MGPYLYIIRVPETTLIEDSDKEEGQGKKKENDNNEKEKEKEKDTKRLGDDDDLRVDRKRLKKS